MLGQTPLHVQKRMAVFFESFSFCMMTSLDRNAVFRNDQDGDGAETREAVSARSEAAEKSVPKTIRWNIESLLRADVTKLVVAWKVAGYVSNLRWSGVAARQLADQIGREGLAELDPAAMTRLLDQPGPPERGEMFRNRGRRELEGGRDLTAVKRLPAEKAQDAQPDGISDRLVAGGHSLKVRVHISSLREI
jgi:hypothetical protein